MAEIRTAARSFVAGAVAMYVFDPRMGRRRRARARDRIFAFWNDLARELDKARRDVVNRAQGLVAIARGIRRREQAGDELLVQRIRSVIGRVVSHPHAIAVRAEGGRVTLEGPILADELDTLLRRAKAVSGVHELVHRLEAHDDASKIPSLQGGTHRESRSEFMQQNWTPSLRVTAAMAGGALVYNGFRKGGALGFVGTLAGGALLARAVANREFRQIIGAGGPRTVEFEKAVHVHAPVEEVFSFWTNYQNFPRFMTHLEEVRDLGNRRSHWVAEGPAGIPVSWQAELTDYVPNKLLAWRSLPGSTVETEGLVRFEKEEDGCTRVGIRLFYSPPAGFLGHAVASLFGADPKREMDDDLVRLKSLIEEGRTRAHGQKITREELSGGAR